ncbi:MAG: SDR family NAD(P)-dependent oxidoreductase [Rhizobiales bacterium]|nr:SDR family NAD(P)-dependent oxidoreductase [Hyphomicrobiales bacterium]
MSDVGVCVVIGAGDDTGAAIARAFAREGLVTCVVRRPRHLERLEALAAEIRAEGYAAHAFEVTVFNIGANVRFPIVETTARIYRKVWEMAAFAGFLTGREAARHMLPRERGTILFTGATASVRGGNGFSAFAGAKHALRALAQSMARELGPKNIHVAHVVIDGAIDTNFIRGIRPDVDEMREGDAILSPDAIAAAYVMLHRQHRSAWTHEMDLRPWIEKW